MKFFENIQSGIRYEYFGMLTVHNRAACNPAFKQKRPIGRGFRARAWHQNGIEFCIARCNTIPRRNNLPNNNGEP